MKYPTLIVITGPESSGKSYLGEKIAESFQWTLTTEYARTYLKNLGRAYVEEDLLKIVEGQYAGMKDLKMEDYPLLMDTDALTIKIWSEEKYQKCDPQITSYLEKNLPDYYLLCRPDIPWEYDPQRENPEDRDRIFSLYQKEIERLQIPYVMIEGNYEERISLAKAFLQKVIL